MKIYQNVEELIGHTPLVRLARLERRLGLSTQILAKVEYTNPASGIKDRVALHMLNRAEEEGRLTPGATVIEPTSGNTGIGLAAVGVARGYRVIIVMPDSMSIERQKLMRAYGAEVVLTPGAEGMGGAIRRAQELARDIPNSFIPSQFENPANPEAHYLGTARELWEDTDGTLDALVAGIGTGGTISGCARYLKEMSSTIFIVGVEPAESPLLTRGESHPHEIQGIGANFIPETLTVSLIDEILPVTATDAKEHARLLASTEGLLVGISAGAAIAAATALAKRPSFHGKTIAVILPDTGKHYLSTDLF